MGLSENPAALANIGRIAAAPVVRFRMSDDSEALDAHSAAVVRVAESVPPSVASLRVQTRRGDGAGSASVLTIDGFLLSSAHVVEGADPAEAAFTGGTMIGADVIRYPTTPCCGRGAPCPHRCGWRTAPS